MILYHLLLTYRLNVEDEFDLAVRQWSMFVELCIALGKKSKITFVFFIDNKRKRYTDLCIGRQSRMDYIVLAPERRWTNHLR